MSRSRHEHQIKLLDTQSGNEFQQALMTVMYRNGALSWLTGAQIADIRREMIERDWFRHKLNRENRKARKRAMAIKEDA